MSTERRPIDLRLAVGAGSAWLVLVGCLGWSPRACVGAAVAAFSLGSGALGLRRRWLQPLALCLFCVALVLLPLAGREQRDRASPLTALANRHAVVSADLVVDGDAKPLAVHGVAGAPRVTVPTRAAALVLDGRRTGVSGAVMLVAPAVPWTGLLPGQRVRLDVQLEPSLAPGPTGVAGFARTGPQLIGRPPWWQRVAGRIRTGLRIACSGLPDEPRGLLPGLVDGDTSGLDPVLAEHFKLAGLTHLVAVSGTNCSIVVGALLLAMRRTRARPWLQAGIGVVAVVAFVVVARPSPSVLRAAFMAVVALAALAAGRPRQGVPALSAAVLVLLAWNPLLARDMGFAMSVLATAALLTIAPPLADALTARRLPAVVAAPLAVATAAHLVTAPLVAAISGRVSLVAIPANLLAEPVVAVTTVLGFVAAVVAPVWLPAARLFAELAGWPCRWLVGVADYFGGLHGATVPWPATAAGAPWRRSASPLRCSPCVRLELGECSPSRCSSAS